MKKYLIGQYFPYLVLGMYGIDLKLPDKIFEDEYADEITAKCEEWFINIKNKFEDEFGKNITITEVVTYTFKKFSSRDIVSLPYKIESGLCVSNDLVQKSSWTKVAEFTVLVAVEESNEEEILEYLSENNYYYKEADENDSFSMILNEG